MKTNSAIKLLSALMWIMLILLFVNSLFFGSAKSVNAQNGTVKIDNQPASRLIGDSIQNHQAVAENQTNSSDVTLANCPMFPSNSIWNARIDALPVHARSTDWVNNIGRSTGFHMDFGSGTWEGGPIGIPYNIADASTTKYTLSFYYPDESDAGPYPIPANPLIEYGSDHHILVVDKSTCKLYEIYDASYSGGKWSGGSGAIWDLNSNALRPDTWTSADAAGLAILPGLVRYDEIASGSIEHAIRFTASETNKYIWPARHLTSNDSAAPKIPPMGARFRLKSTFDISGYSSEMQIILLAMQRYGIILADNGSDWYVSGAPDPRWDNDMLHTLDDITGDDFEAVDTSQLMLSSDSGEVITNQTSINISGNAGAAGVKLQYLDGTTKSVTSAQNGNYLIRVPVDWSGTLTPSKTGIPSFSPPERTYSLVAGTLAGQNYRPNKLVTFSSVSDQDGYIRESSELSNIGGMLDSKSNTIMLGDDNLKRQFRAVLSFASASLPDNCVIVSAVVKLTRQSVTPESPFTNLGRIAMDIRKPAFGSGTSLVLSDFSAPAGLLNAGWVTSVPIGNVYSGSLDAAAFPQVNLKGNTQIRLRFELDDDNDLAMDKIAYYSGNSSTAAYKPVLSILYHLP